MLHTLQAEPIRLITDDPAALPAADATPWAALTVLAFAVCVIAGLLLLRAFAARDPAELAFRRLARRLGISARERRALVDSARKREVHPIGALFAPAVQVIQSEPPSRQALARSILQALAGPPSAGRR